MTRKKLAGVALGVALLFGATAPAYAATQDEQLASLLAQVRALQAQLAGAGGERGVFSANLTVGSSGIDVTRLQNFLIARGHSLSAGATGYFGAQTRAALAAYQAAQGIVPAAGYFGPITRARVNAMTAVTPMPAPSDAADDSSISSDRKDAREAIDDLAAAIDDAQEDIDDAEDEGEDVDEANDLLDDARDLLADARDAYADKDYDEVMDLVDEAEDLIDEALDEVSARSNDTHDARGVETSAETVVVSGADNDYATFKIRLALKAFGDDMYVPKNASDAITYQIEDASDGSVTASASSLSASLSSSANHSGDYYFLRENDEETFTLIVTFNPVPSDEGKSYRLQLLTIRYNDSKNIPDSTWSTHGNSKYRTPATFISD